MKDTTNVTSFIADWFERFDQLAPIGSFLPDLHPQVHWDMPDTDPDLHGHDRVRDWYDKVLATFTRPTEHHVTDIQVSDHDATFNVLFRGRTHQGELIELSVRETWRFEIRADGRPLITQYSASLPYEAPQ
ncbi:MAG: hypothetical protein GJ676_12735 [Rhodobacteraceae bacterium]|nr:hypothetical protein [Paracoccaceae bacterium]